VCVVHRQAHTGAAGRSLAQPGTKQATATEDSEFNIYNHNWGNISTIYIYNKTSIKRNILTIKQNTSGSRSSQGLISTPVHGQSRTTQNSEFGF
jgi:hypothetical protein